MKNGQKWAKKSLKWTKMTQNEPKMDEKRQKVSFFSRSIRQYPSTFQESDKTRCTKAPNMLNANILRCYNSKIIQSVNCVDQGL